MSDLQDGGAAFPRAGFTTPEEHPCYETEPQDGMTLRDWFAGQALAGMMASWDTSVNDGTGGNLLNRAEFCYRFADGMLTMRAAVKPEQPDEELMAEAEAAEDAADAASL